MYVRSVVYTEEKRNEQRNRIELPIRVSNAFGYQNGRVPFLYFAAAGCHTRPFLYRIHVSANFISRYSSKPCHDNNRPPFSSVWGGGVDIGGIYFSASVLARKMAGKSFENGDNDDQAKGENQFRWIYAHIYIYTPFENGFVVRSARENGKGILMRCEELKVCVQRGGGTDIKVEGLISRGTGGGKDITVEAARIITTSLRWMEDGCVLNDSFSLQFGFLLDSVSKFIIRALTPLCARVSSYNPTFYYYTYIFTFVNFNFGNFFKSKVRVERVKIGGDRSVLLADLNVDIKVIVPI